jgi:uncharacterized protein YutE (UPF0331/DUF86 family)
MRLEREVIEGRFDIIDRNIRFLEEIKTISPDQFVESYKDTQAAKYSLLEIIEVCIDIANYIISVKGFRRAEEYSEMFRVLREEKVIKRELAAKLENMARFRNLLVHRYGEIDNRRVLEIIKHNLRDVEEFEKGIERFVKKDEETSFSSSKH